MMRKAFLLLILAFNFSHADYLYSNLAICVKEYWFYGANLYYVSSQSGATIMKSAGGTSSSLGFYDGFEYNSTSGKCSPIAKNNTLNMSNDDYNFSMSVTGLFCGVLLSSFVLVSLRLSL